MIGAFWYSNGKTVWFRFNGKVYSRKILKHNKWLMPQVNFQGDKWYLPNNLCRLDLEDILNPHQYAMVCNGHMR